MIQSFIVIRISCSATLYIYLCESLFFLVLLLKNNNKMFIFLDQFNIVVESRRLLKTESSTQNPKLLIF